MYMCLCAMLQQQRKSLRSELGCIATPSHTEFDSARTHKAFVSQDKTEFVRDHDNRQRNRVVKIVVSSEF